MLNPHTRTNTIISQSFIASEFQTFNDPFVNSGSKSSLNQLVKARQTSQSGLVPNPQSQSFGFNNLKTSQEANRIQKFNRKSFENNTVLASSNFKNQPISQTSPYQLNKNQMIQIVSPQKPPHQRYIPAGSIRTQSFPRFDQSPSRVQKVGLNLSEQQINGRFQQQQQIIQSQPMFYENKVGQSPSKMNKSQFITQPQPQPQSQSQPQSQNIVGQQFRAQSFPIERDQKFLDVVSSQKTLVKSKIGQGMKLNISQQFSDSFVLKCVNQPQKSTILSMKQRQREYRKSIQNFLL